jgi:general secretion pathway protein K
VWRRSGGFALLIVLWTLVLIAFIVARMTASGRTEIRIAENLRADAAAEAADDGAIYSAIFNQLDPNPDERWPLNGRPRELMIGSSRVMVQLEDEAGRINPSTASPALLEALLRTTGSNAESARRLAAAIGEWVGSAAFGSAAFGERAGSAADARPRNAVLADYRAAGLDYGPPGEPLETLDELGRVLGMTPAVFAAIRPHLTLFGPPQPNAQTADPIVTAALAATGQVPQALVPGNQPPPDLLLVRITATAFGPGNARVSKAAILRVGAMLPGGYAVLAWGAGTFD